MVKSNQYRIAAELYDLEMSNREIPALYKEWQKELESAVKKYNVKVSTLIDLACGTGNTTIPWIEKGYKIIGIDMSRSMLKVAKKKSKKVIWYQQDITKLDIKEKAEAVTCHYDALNHILSKDELQRTFDNIYSILSKGGLFIFDLNTENKFEWLNHREKLFQIGQNYYVARNKYNPKTKIIEFEQIWFVKTGDRYKKKETLVKERAYSKQEIKHMLKKSGFKLLEIKVQSTIDKNPSRLVYLVRKKRH